MVLFNPQATLANLGSLTSILSNLNSSDATNTASIAYAVAQTASLTTRMDALGAFDDSITTLLGQVNTLNTNFGSTISTLGSIDTVMTGFEGSLAGAQSSYPNHLNDYNTASASLANISLTELQDFTGVTSAFNNVFA